MFTGIIEAFGTVSKIVKDQQNLHVTIDSEIAKELKIDQSVSHNGVCLTVIAVEGGSYTVTMIKETLDKSTAANWREGDLINLERAMKLGDRLDGHLVQGHVDQIGICKSIANDEGSWKYTFEYDANQNNITIEKGSITVNGVSLTVVDARASRFSVAIIPYTYEHTNFKNFNEGTQVNLEFDVIGKYVARLNALGKEK